MTDHSHSEDLLTGPGFEEPALRKDLIPDWMKKLFWVLMIYKVYSILRSVTLYLAISHTLQAANHMGQWVAFLALDVLAILSCLGLLWQWKPAPTVGIIVLGVYLLTMLGYFVYFLIVYAALQFSLPSALLLETATTLVSSGILILILVRLFKIRRAWENGVAGK